MAFEQPGKGQYTGIFAMVKNISKNRLEHLHIAFVHMPKHTHFSFAHAQTRTHVSFAHAQTSATMHLNHHALTWSYKYKS